ncbi:MAG: NAD(P)H-hydrate dehydratase [Euryarchaeota archaeon]|nr:NAD(P)H-hydrate dehydratase [Euryarchaeota archaeon]
MPLSPADVKALDRNAEALGVPTAELMENAGLAVAFAVKERWPEGTVVVVAGPGNNGGDGCIAARALHEAGRAVYLLVVGAEEGMKSEVAQDALDEAEEAGVKVLLYTDPNLDDLIDEADIVVDALLGVGVHGALRPPFDRVVAHLSDHEAPIVAVDLPTGHGTDTPLVATLTVTMHDVKDDMDPEICGEIVVADIGIPEEAQTHVGPGDLLTRYPRSEDTGHKGDHGRLIIVGGGPYSGAPSLTALGAMMTGLDLCHLILPADAASVARHNLLEAIVVTLAGHRFGIEHVDTVVDHMDDADALVIGPGLGDAPETVEAVRETCLIAKQKGIGMVLDADALRWKDAKELLSLGAILTPHAGEFKRISGKELPQEDDETRIDIVRTWIGDSDTTILLKGAPDLIITKDQVSRNVTHHPVMTTGGTGDVLCGVVGALLSRGCSPFDAARLGAYINGAAGLLAYEDQSYGVRAGDVAGRIPFILAEDLNA